METLLRRPPQAETDRPKSFDREIRIRNDTVTWLAEALNGSMRTRFEFRFNGVELFGEDGEPLRQIFDNSVREAHLMTRYNPGLFFELRRRLLERGELEDMEAMARGRLYTDDGQAANTIVVISDFPPELMNASGHLKGYNANRKQTMLRLIFLESDGTVSITTQSLDGSDRQALEAIPASLGKSIQPGELLGQRINLSLSSKHQRRLADNLTQVYDDVMAREYGGKWHAGIRKDGKRLAVDTYKFAAGQHDLIDYFTQYKLADSRGAERVRFKVAAAASARYERKVGGLEGEAGFKPGRVAPQALVSYRSVAGGQRLLRELDREGSRAATQGKVFSGCGETVKAETDPDDPLSSRGQLKLAGYGNHEEEDEYGSLTFKCPNGHTNKRPRHKLLDTCRHCTAKVNCGPEQKRLRRRIERRRGEPLRIGRTLLRQR